MKFIPLSVPNISQREKNLINEALDANWVSSGGPYVTRFEEDVRKYVGSDYAIACQSGTAGLHLALRALNVGEGDLVIVPTLTFIATVNPVKYVGADPIFMDCDDRLVMDLDKLEAFLDLECKLEETQLIHRDSGKSVKAIVAVHIFGYMIDMSRLMEIAKKYNLFVIEDATEALGTTHESKHAGTFSDIGVYSFNGNKIMTTGGGGMIVTNNQTYADKMRYLSTQAKDDELYYVHNEIGYNYRMTTVQACLGIGQLERLEDFIKTKQKNLDKYIECIGTVEGIKFIDQQKHERPNRWFYAFEIDEKLLNYTRDELIKRLQAEGIQTRPVWSLIHKQKPYAHSLSYKIEKALNYEKTLINLPCSTDLSEEDIHYVCEKIVSLINSKL